MIPLPDAGEWMVVFNSDSRYYDSDFGDFGNFVIHAEVIDKDGLPAQAKVSVAPYSALILSQATSMI
jgi:1,4-alpha-glucan branching enzyme